MNKNSEKIVYLLNGVSTLGVPRNLEIMMIRNNLKLDRVYKSIFSIFDISSNNLKCVITPMNSCVINYSLIDKGLLTGDIRLDNIIRKISNIDKLEILQTRTMASLLFSNLLHEYKDHMGIIVEPLRTYRTTNSLTLYDPDVVIDINNKVPIKIVSELLEFSVGNELLVDVQYKENGLLNLIDEDDELSSMIVDVHIRNELLLNRSKFVVLHAFMQELKNKLIGELVYE